MLLTEDLLSNFILYGAMLFVAGLADLASVGSATNNSFPQIISFNQALGLTRKISVGYV